MDRVLFAVEFESKCPRSRTSVSPIFLVHQLGNAIDLLFDGGVLMIGGVCGRSGARWLRRCRPKLHPWNIMVSMEFGGKVG